jgi:hypothetical protein
LYHKWCDLGHLISLFHWHLPQCSALLTSCIGCHLSDQWCHLSIVKAEQIGLGVNQ